MKSNVIIKEKAAKGISIGFGVKIILLISLGYVFLSKEVNFSINLNSPIQKEESEKIIPSSKSEIHTEKSTSVKVEKIKESPKKNDFASFTSSIFGGNKKTRKKVSYEIVKLEDIPEETIIAYINRFVHVAQNEKRKYGIPASIILSHCLYQSAAGQSKIARESNNHFHIFCDTNWEGMMKDYNGKCFRKYESAWSSFRGHSIFMSNNFKELFSFGPNNYKAWAKGIGDSGVFSDKKLTKKLLYIIDKYNLNQYE